MAWRLARSLTSTAHIDHPPNSPHLQLNFFATKLQCLSLLNVCSSMRELTQIHAQIQICGLHRDGFIVSEIIRFCALSPSGNLEYSHCMLERAVDLTPLSWNLVIRGYSSSNQPREALLVYHQMRDRCPCPNKLTFPFLLKACARKLDLEVGRQVHAEIVKRGIDSDVYVLNTLIHFYGSCQRVLNARQVFEEMLYRTVVSWTAIITVYVENLRYEEASEAFRLMKICGFEPDQTTMVVLLTAFAELGDLRMGRLLHRQVIGNGSAINLQLGTALLNMYAKCGDIGFAHRIFNIMPERNVWTWSAMISGFAQHGRAAEALQLFSQMKRVEIQPNHVTFLGVLSACSHAGLVDDGYRFFYEMVQLYDIKPITTHYSAMVDILGRSGRLEEAYKFILDMPIEADGIVWRTLFGACVVHDAKNVTGIGEKVRQRLIELEPSRSGNYVMVSNAYAEIGLWEKAAKVRKLMREEGMKKVAGESCVQVGGVFSRFFSGDNSQVDCQDIYFLLDGLTLNTMSADSLDGYDHSAL